MQCGHPIKIWDKKRKENILVPCGQCALCRKNYAQEWTMRILAELEYSKTAHFITLTYSDENLPYNMSLEPEHLRKFWKALRKRKMNVEGEKIKYFACGEYGDAENGQVPRPHYHAIVFNLDLKIDKLYRTWDIGGKCNIRSSELDYVWKYGLNQVGTVERRSAQYVAGYIRKKLTGKLGEEKYGENIPPFSRVSKGIGERYTIEHAEELLERQAIYYDNGVRKSIPRTMWKWLERELGSDRVDPYRDKEGIKQKMQAVEDAIRFADYKNEVLDGMNGKQILNYGEKGRFRKSVLKELEIQSKHIERKNI